MQYAYNNAKIAYKQNEVPVGVILVVDNKILASEYNKIRTFYDPTAHAEILAIRTASKKLQTERLINVDMYTTLEPCCMCAGAIILARIKNVYCLAPETRSIGLQELLEQKKFNHYPKFTLLSLDECDSLSLLRSFFEERRKK